MIVLGFWSHYAVFLLSPSGLLALVVAVPLACVLIRDMRGMAVEFFGNGSTPSPRVPGCVRLGMYKRRSNLSHQASVNTLQSQGPRVRSLWVYPIKSAGGIEMGAVEVQSTGLRFDRMFTFARRMPRKGSDADGKATWQFITQREVPNLALLKIDIWIPEIQLVGGKTPLGPSNKNDEGLINENIVNGGCIIIRFPATTSHVFGLLKSTHQQILQIPLTPTPYRQRSKGYSFEEVSVWTDSPVSLNVTNEIPLPTLSKLKACLGFTETEDLALFRTNDCGLRTISRALPKDEPFANATYNVGFADAFPVTFMSVASVQALGNDRKTRPVSKLSSIPSSTVDARRFRVNIYVEGISAFEEDSWTRIETGCTVQSDKGNIRNPAIRESKNASYHIACRTARCKLPNTDQDTAMVNRNEPYATLRKTRQVDEGAKPYPVLGLSAIPLFERGILRVGDEICVLRTGEHRYEKMFP